MRQLETMHKTLCFEICTVPLKPPIVYNLFSSFFWPFISGRFQLTCFLSLKKRSVFESDCGLSLLLMQRCFCFTPQATNAEEYFDVHASAVATSDRTLSRLDLPQMDIEALRETIKKSGATHMKQCRTLCGQHEQLFRRWMFYMWLVVFSWGFCFAKKKLASFGNIHF